MNSPLSWFTPRGYLHFDIPVEQLTVEKIVTNPQTVAKYPFYPFIGFEVKSKKIAYDLDNKHIYEKDKIRPIAYAAHLDSHIYSYYCQMLSDLYEGRLSRANLTNNVLAFRKLHKGNIEFARDVFKEINKSGNCHVIALDIQKFFDKIDHEILKKEWCELISQPRLPQDHFAVFKSLTQHRKVDRRELFKKFGLSLRNPHKQARKYRICDSVEFRKHLQGTDLIQKNIEKFGIPQGSPISALLSNVYLFDFDNLIAADVSKVGGSYFRYCDDIFIIISDNPNYFIDLATNTLKSFKLDINLKKKEIRQFHKNGVTQSCDKPVQYLGFIFDGQKILLRSATLARFSARMKKAVRVAKASMRKLNLIRIKRGELPQKLYRKKLYDKFSYLGKRNFISYGYRAAKIMDSSAIRKQLKPLWPRLQKEIGDI